MLANDTCGSSTEAPISPRALASSASAGAASLGGLGEGINIGLAARLVGREPPALGTLVLLDVMVVGLAGEDGEEEDAEDVDEAEDEAHEGPAL